MTEKINDNNKEAQIECTLDYNFNSEFARSLSCDILKYENDKNSACKDATMFSNDTTSELSSARSYENINKSDEDKQKQLWNDTIRNKNQVKMRSK